MTVKIKMIGTPETPLQRDMFSGQAIDNRTRQQKRLDRQVGQPQQMGMFSLKETVEIGVSARPWLRDLPAPKLELEREDPRTDEEREQDLLREAQALTGAMFAIAETPETAQEHPPEPHPQRVQIPVTIFHRPIVGRRKQLRQAKIRVRARVL